jgi:hypothetical protein
MALALALAAIQGLGRSQREALSVTRGHPGDSASRLANDSASCVTAVCKGLYCRSEVAWG